MAGAAVHAGVRAAIVVRHDTLTNVDEVDLADGRGLDDVIVAQPEELNDASDVAAVADLMKDKEVAQVTVVVEPETLDQSLKQP